MNENKYTYISTDTEEYNRGRAEGQADVAVELRKILDPHDKLHLNLTGTLKRVEELLADNNRLRDALASWEATWYVCHDGSESACCKDHE
jgi:hypothetical protein